MQGSKQINIIIIIVIITTIIEDINTIRYKKDQHAITQKAKYGNTRQRNHGKKTTLYTIIPLEIHFRNTFVLTTTTPFLSTKQKKHHTTPTVIYINMS